ncbi:hypothetical protein A1Q1_03174 [Trichosporon asahii var. asahii CBS 2479]|uniref:Uncharacterized protein n=1 Tax=Trichosporon asahii var. asahii (strain ATCC 90039 / CBS 2479 / JCM 2466 / KCTC 7840 / NBRC 103889/ NCYC 2677 / UAMH 7654) TaxID=1186058 RepID=J6ETP5_TRIAS|nr:hypothetical protein A1Q1_03174 [Trichosporon asahii var. asahii CBS 2479]EJT47939.1 hypothetical protein A1Q1_03174 [Trichosporon asahii var. asahii CBS 2479]
MGVVLLEPRLVLGDATGQVLDAASGSNPITRGSAAQFPVVEIARQPGCHLAQRTWGIFLWDVSGRKAFGNELLHDLELITVPVHALKAGERAEDVQPVREEVPNDAVLDVVAGVEVLDAQDPAPSEGKVWATKRRSAIAAEVALVLGLHQPNGHVMLTALDEEPS